MITILDDRPGSLRGTGHLLRVAGRFFANRASMAALQENRAAAARVAVSDLATELRKLPRLARLLRSPAASASHPVGYSRALLAELRALPVTVRDASVDPVAFAAHVKAVGYPRAYAAGPLDEGGNRENKLLEYFLSLQILDLRPGQILIDVASEYSIFPTVARQRHGATVYRQDLIFPPGLEGDRIGGSAAAMSVDDGFADVLVLHNSFEHFEGDADTRFVTESCRVLRPGGTVVIIPLFVSDRYSILSDPLNDRRGIEWDPGAEVIELPGWHNRFGRFYDPSALERRVLAPARKHGYAAEILHFTNITDVHPKATTYFALVLRKPERSLPRARAGRLAAHPLHSTA